MHTTHHQLFDPHFLGTFSYETPYFLFSKEKIQQKLAKFHQLFPNAAVHYAMKANSEPHVLELLHQQGSGFEVASIFELELLKKLSVPADRIIYGTSVKPVSHIKEFVQYGVKRFAFDSFSELDKLAITAPSSKVYVRTIANDSGSVFKFSEKFGTEKENIVPLLLKARELGLKPYGISFHVGSQASDSMAWANCIEGLVPILKELQERDIHLEVINLGGGFPCQYASSVEIPSLEDIAHSISQSYKKLSYQPKQIIEPGRGMIADAGVAITSVIAKVERKGSTWLFLDLGVYNGLFETMAYQGSTRYPITSMRKVGDSGEMLFALAGPTGDSPDIISREALLPRDVEVGDKLIIHNVGAYSLVVTSPFNGFPKPAVYTI